MVPKGQGAAGKQEVWEYRHLCGSVEGSGVRFVAVVNFVFVSLTLQRRPP